MPKKCIVHLLVMLLKKVSLPILELHLFIVKKNLPIRGKEGSFFWVEEFPMWDDLHAERTRLWNLIACTTRWGNTWLRKDVYPPKNLLKEPLCSSESRGKNGGPREQVSHVGRRNTCLGLSKLVTQRILCIDLRLSFEVLGWGVFLPCVGILL